MKYREFRGILQNSTILVKRLMEECSPELTKAMNEGYMHSYLYGKVDEYLKENGIRADRKSINVITDLGKELFITKTVECLFFKKESNNDL